MPRFDSRRLHHSSLRSVWFRRPGQASGSALRARQHARLPPRQDATLRKLEVHRAGHQEPVGGNEVTPIRDPQEARLLACAPSHSRELHLKADQQEADSKRRVMTGKTRHIDNLKKRGAYCANV
jgi:hypothetical protein